MPRQGGYRLTTKGNVVSIVTASGYVRTTGGSRYPRQPRCHHAWHGPEAEYWVRGSSESLSRLRMKKRGNERRESPDPDRACGRPKQNNSPTPLLGTAMISYFWQGAVFFFLLECGGRTRTVNAESLTWRAGAAFLTAARASHHPSDVGGDPARCCDRGSVCVRWGHPINENTLSAARERERQKFNQPPRSAREFAHRPPRTSRSLDQRRRGREEPRGLTVAAGFDAFA